MRKIALALVLLAACGRSEKPPGVTIAITADGFVRVEGKAVTLDELGTWLAARREAGPREQVDHAIGVSALPVVIDPEDDAAWIHVAWVMTILAEEKFWRLTLPGGREAPLPVDSGIMPILPPPEGVALLVRVQILETGDYRLGLRSTRDLEKTGAWIDRAPRDGFLCRMGVIHAQPRVPWQRVRAVVDLLRGHGLKRIEFAGDVPSRDERERSPLPVPPPAPPPEAWRGFVSVAYWSEPEWFEGPLDEPLRKEDGLLAWVGDHRLGLGLSALVVEEALCVPARSHAEEMHRMNYLGHFSPVPGSHSPGDRLAKAGWPEERRHAELLAKAESAEAAIRAILAEPENVKILADPAFKYAGVAQSGDCWVVLLGAAP